MVSNNLFDARLSTTPGSGVDVRTTTTTDNILAAHNILLGAGSVHQVGSAHAFVTDTIQAGATGDSSATDFLASPNTTLTSLTAGQRVSITAAAGAHYHYDYVEKAASGALVTTRSGTANSDTGTICTVAAGHTGILIYRKIGAPR